MANISLWPILLLAAVVGWATIESVLWVIHWVMSHVTWNW